MRGVLRGLRLPSVLQLRGARDLAAGRRRRADQRRGGCPLLLPPLFAVYRTSADVAGEGAPGQPRRAHRAAQPQAACSRPLDAARCAEARATGGVALFLLDLDRFKEVNDTLGHHDRRPAARARRRAASRGALRAEDTVARLGGDEFAVLLPDVPRRRRRDRGRRAADPGRARRAVPPRGHAAARSRPASASRCYPDARRRRRSSCCARRHRDVRGQGGAHRRRGLRARHATAHSPTGSACSARCARRSTTASSSCTTSPRSRSRPARSSASRRWCAGATRSAAWSSPTSSSRWPSSPA